MWKRKKKSYFGVSNSGSSSSSNSSCATSSGSGGGKLVVQVNVHAIPLLVHHFLSPMLLISRQGTKKSLTNNRRSFHLKSGAASNETNNNSSNHQISASQIKLKLKQHNNNNNYHLSNGIDHNDEAATMSNEKTIPEHSSSLVSSFKSSSKPIGGHMTHIQSYQSLSSVMVGGGGDGVVIVGGGGGGGGGVVGLTGTKSTHKLSHLAMTMGNKPLNRNSRRASMSELGYGKIESYSKLEKLGEVI